MNENPCKELVVPEHTVTQIDYHKFVDALKHCVKHPEEFVGQDVYTMAVRIATGIPDLVLTPDQRKQVKLAGHATLYGASGADILHMLGKSLRPKDTGGRRSAIMDINKIEKQKPIYHVNLIAKNERILKRVIEKLGRGDYRVSQRGVPHVVVDEFYSVVRYGSGKLAVFDNYGKFGPGEQNKRTFPHWNAVVDYLKTVVK